MFDRTSSRFTLINLFLISPVFDPIIMKALISMEPISIRYVIHEVGKSRNKFQAENRLRKLLSHGRFHSLGQETVWEWTDSLQNSEVQNSVFCLSARIDWPRPKMSIFLGGESVRDFTVMDPLGNLCKGPWWLGIGNEVVVESQGCCRRHRAQNDLLDILSVYAEEDPMTKPGDTSPTRLNKSLPHVVNALYDAVARGDTEALEIELLNQPVSVRLGHRSTVLHIAARHGKEETVGYLIRAGADLDAQMNDGWTALYVAAYNGHVQVVEALLNAKADPNVRADDGSTALIAAAQKGRSAVVAKLLDANADTSVSTQFGCTALYSACREGHFDIVDSLVRRGANVYASAVDGWTCIHISSVKGHVAVVQRLILAEERVVNCRTPDGTTGLHLAAKEGHSDIVRTLLAEKADMSAITNDLAAALYYGVFLDLITASQELYAMEWDPVTCQHAISSATNYTTTQRNYNYQMFTGAMVDHWSPLHVATWNNRIEIVQILCGAGVDLNARTDRGWTAMHMASKKGYADIVRCLLQQEAVIDHKTNGGKTCLDLMATENRVESLSILLGRTRDIPRSALKRCLDMALGGPNPIPIITQLLEAMGNPFPERGTNPSALSLLTIAFPADGRHSKREGVRLGEFLNSIYPKNGGILGFLAESQWKAGLRDEAIQTLDEMIAMNPHNRDVLNAVEVVHRNVMCDKCRTYPLRGYRYMCVGCWKFNLCQKCGGEHGENYKRHRFIVVPSRDGIERMTRLNETGGLYWEVED
jgi:ankyrin repeat protein